MMKNIMKTVFWALFVIATTSPVRKAEALIPMPTLPSDKMSAIVQNVVQAVQEIKEEVDKNKKIIDEIASGGFMAAAGELFGKIQNGDYDRFGQNLSAIKNNSSDAFALAGSVKRQSDHMRHNKDSNLSTKEKREAAAKAEEEYQQKRQEKLDKKALDKAKNKCIKMRTKNYTKDGKSEEEAKSLATKECSGKTLEELTSENQSSSKFNDAYRWLQNNRAATRSGLDAIQAGMDNDWSGALAAGGSGFGSAMYDTEDENFGKMVSSGTSLIDGVVDATKEGSINDAYRSLNNSGVVERAKEVGSAYKGYEKQRSELENSGEGGQQNANGNN